MNSAEIVTIKPQDGVIEYQIKGPGGELLGHGYQVSLELTAELTGADLQTAVNADAEARNLLGVSE